MVLTKQGISYLGSSKTDEIITVAGRGWSTRVRGKMTESRNSKLCDEGEKKLIHREGIRTIRDLHSHEDIFLHKKPLGQTQGCCKRAQQVHHAAGDTAWPSSAKRGRLQQQTDISD